ncbi:terminase large subunit domain-containing protein [Frankia sp. AgW1.1]|uniref:terminase large subunit domain-containing protein n=1 Tax=Frankia sp. AgW1.1 TaxID=1836971 RepID=UPI001933F70D|nr:terminase family protein [Frankia sp. AgW1.1]MBL7487104.1 DNA-packaging protein [Frankia sp. AgW1.1]
MPTTTLPKPATFAERRLTLLRRELELRRKLEAATVTADRPWACNLDDCDGEPHGTFTWKHARTAQRAPDGDWLVWLILAGRGWGKSRTGAETLVQRVVDTPTAPDGSPTEWAIVAETFSDARLVCVEGPAGVRTVLNNRHIDYVYNRSLWQIRFATGQIIHMLGADDADVGRGLNLSGGWFDEIAKWRYARASWTEGLAPALRIGRPQVIVTTTPKPSILLKDWMGRDDGSVVVTRGSTFDNAANLSSAALSELRKRYEGTRLGRQELYGEYLDDNPGALWQRANIDEHRRGVTTLPDLVRIVVAVDPAGTANEESDHTGIVVAGRDSDGHFWVLADLTLKASPDGWARAAVEAYHQYKADRIVAETNFGADMVESTIRHVERNVPYTKVTASRGKKIRAEPVSALYEQGRVHHVGGLPDLEDEMISWTPDADWSPNRVDALVWAISDLADISGTDYYMRQLLAEDPEQVRKEEAEARRQELTEAVTERRDPFRTALGISDLI